MIYDYGIYEPLRIVWIKDNDIDLDNVDTPEGLRDYIKLKKILDYKYNAYNEIMKFKDNGYLLIKDKDTDTYRIFLSEKGYEALSLYQKYLNK